MVILELIHAASPEGTYLLDTKQVQLRLVPW